jgi:phytoene dehydrogenase-like protein
MATGRVIVVGGGPAGLMAAGQAAELGAETVLLEKMDRPGRKLRITGKGRCNLTNIAHVSEFVTHFGPNGRFLRQAFARFFSPDLLAFLEGLGVGTVTERGGRVFPASGLLKPQRDAEEAPASGGPSGGFLRRTPLSSRRVGRPTLAPGPRGMGTAWPKQLDTRSCRFGRR